MVSTIGTAFKAVAFAALNKFETLNKVVDKLSGGSVNRDTLAQSVLRDGIALGGDYMVKWKTLGERTPQLLPALRDTLVDNDMDRMKGGIEKLLKTFLGETAGTLAGLPAKALAEKLLGDHALEKVVATHVKQHGWKPLEEFLGQALGGVPGGKFIAGQLKAILERTMARQEFDSSGSAEFRLLGDLFKEILAGSGNYMKPLRDYAPTLAPLTESVVKTVRDGVDQLSQTVLGPPESVDVRDAFRKDIEQAKKDVEDLRKLTQENGGDPETVKPFVPTLTAPQLHEDTTDRDIAQLLVKEQVLSEVLGVEPTSAPKVQQEVDKALEKGIIDGQRHQEVTELVNKLSTEQLLPLGERGGIEVSHTTTGRLDRVEAQSHKVTELRDELDQLTRDALNMAPTDTTTVNGFVIGRGYAQQSGKLDLQLPESEYGYTDTAMESGRTLMNFGWGMLGYQTESHQTGTEIRQLYNTCNKNEAMLSSVTRFLDPEVAKAALVGPTLEQMRDPESGLVRSGDVFLKLKDPGNPRFTFEVQKVGEMVTVGIEAVWDVEQFGTDPQDLRKPEGGKPSEMRSTCVITIKPDPQGGPPLVSPFPMGVLASVNNVIQFDLTTGGRKTEM